MKLLIVEDNERLAAEISDCLTDNAFIVETAGRFVEAKDKIAIYNYDLVIIDIGLPDGNGLDLIESINKNQNNTGILIVTAKHALDSKIQGLEMGADDYLTKPFHKAELNARVRSILRRRKAGGSNLLTFNEIEVDINAMQVKINAHRLSLTQKEYDLLLYLIYNKDRLLTKESIAEHLWGDDIDQADNFNFIYNHIKNLRRKIDKAGGKDYIKSMYGMGYKFTDN